MTRRTRSAMSPSPAAIVYAPGVAARAAANTHALDAQVRPDLPHEELELVGIRPQQPERELPDAGVDARLEARDELLRVAHQVDRLRRLVRVVAERAQHA